MKCIKSQSISVVGTNLVITLPSNVSLSENEYFYIILCQCIPSDASTLPVVFEIGATEYNGLNRIGNTLRADQLRCRYRYCGVYGVDNPHIMIKSHVPETKYINEVIK